MAGLVVPRIGARTGPSPWLILLAAAAVGVWATTKGPEELGGLPILLAGFVVVPIWMFATNRPAHALAVVLLYMGLLDGFLKLKVASGNELPTIGRDVLLYAVAIGMLVRAIIQRRPIDLPPLSVWVFLWIALVLIQLANPYNNSWVHAITATRQHIEFVPLFFIGYTVMRTPGRVRAFLLIFLLIAAVNGVVSLVQFNLTPEQLSNWGPGYRGLITGESGVAPRVAAGDEEGTTRTRPMALGSDMGFGGVLGGMALPAALALLAASGVSLRMKLLVAALGLGAVTAVATSQARGAIVASLLCVAAFTVIGISARRLPKFIAAFAVVAALSFLVLSEIQGKNETAFARYDSVAPGQVLDTTFREREGLFKSVPNYVTKYPFGAGLGSVGPASGVFDPPKKRGLSAESQVTYTIVEVGVLGLIVLFGFLTHLLVVVIPKVRRVADRDLRLMLAALAAPFFLLLASAIVGAITPSTPTAPYIWFGAGALLWWAKHGYRQAATQPAATQPRRV